MRTRMNSVVNTVAAIAFLTIVAGPAIAREPAVVKRVFENPDGRKVGKVWIMNNPDGPDAARFEFLRLPPNEGFTLHLSNSAVMGSVPTVLVAQFRTDENGTAELMLMTEIIDAYVTTNQRLENDRGIAVTGIDSDRPPGAVDNGGNTVSLIYFRVYSIKPGAVASVFGTDAITDGGGHVASTVGAFCTVCPAQ